jgi:hypothetical protein
MSVTRCSAGMGCFLGGQLPGNDHDWPPGQMQEPVRDTSEGEGRQIGASARADNYHPGIVFVSGFKYDPGNMAELRSADFGICRHARVPQVREDLSDEAFRLTFRTVDLEPAEPSDSEFMNMQNDDLVTGIAC